MSQGRIFYEKSFSDFLYNALAKSEMNCIGALLLCKKKG
ncbi:hypothetical protein TSL1_12580 [Sulfurovum sp. TSL1]|nr:hypothetical protein TSL1_12580 [Sulfurovum sp. TSL1]